jgi:hypothetical protein
MKEENICASCFEEADELAPCIECGSMVCQECMGGIDDEDGICDLCRNES